MNEWINEATLSLTCLVLRHYNQLKSVVSDRGDEWVGGGGGGGGEDLLRRCVSITGNN